MAGNWDALGLGGVGRVDVRGATPPIGNTGPGGVEGMGLMALLRRLSMGMDEPKDPMSPDPASPRGMPQTLGQLDQMMDMGRMMMGLEQPQMGIQGPAPTDLEAMGGQAMPMEPSAFDFEQAFGRPYTPPPEQQDQTAMWEMLRRMGVPY